MQYCGEVFLHTLLCTSVEPVAETGGCWELEAVLAGTGAGLVLALLGKGAGHTPSLMSLYGRRPWRSLSRLTLAWVLAKRPLHLALSPMTLCIVRARHTCGTTSRDWCATPR